MTTDERLEIVQRAIEKEERAKIDKKIASILAILKTHRSNKEIARRIFEVMEER